MKKLQIWADGGCRNNGKPNALGGWGWVAVAINNDSETQVMCNHGSSEDLITNNQNEIYSITKALRNLISPVKGLTLNIFMDSALVVNCINNRWHVAWNKNGWKNSKKQPVANRALWERLLDEIDRIENLGVVVVFNKVKGHSDNDWNNYADTLVNKAMNDAVSELA